MTYGAVGWEAPEITSQEMTSSEVMKAKMDAPMIARRVAGSTADVQTQDECLPSVNESNLSLQDMNRLSSANKQREINLREKPVLTNWNVIHREVSKEDDLVPARKSLLALPVRYERRGANPRWKKLVTVL